MQEFSISSLNLLINALCYDDPSNQVILANPQQTILNTSVQQYLTVQNPQTQKFSIAPNSSVTVFDGTRAVNISATTQFSLTTTTPNVYRIYNNAGPSSAFRTLRSINTNSTSQFTVSVNNNSVVSLTGNTFSTGSVSVGDILYINSTATFNILNQGSYPVIAVGTGFVQYRNANAAAESITIGANFASDLKIFSAAGVQVGDVATISAGFSPVTQGSYVVSNVIDSFFEFNTALALPIETAIIPGATGINFYSNAKRLILLTADQLCYVQLNADTSTLYTLEPVITTAASTINGVWLKNGTQFRCVVQNRSAINTCNLFTFTAE